MALAKASDLSTLVHKSIESLREIETTVDQQDFEEPINETYIKNIIETLQQMENNRLQLHELLESETITASSLRYELQRMPLSAKNEIHNAVLSARQSNEEEIQKLQDNLKSINMNINKLEERGEELKKENSKLEPERDEMQGEYNTVVSKLNQTMADKASKQITLNETRDTLRETYKTIIDLEESIVQLKEDLALEREEAVKEKERLRRAVEDTQTKVDDQKKLNTDKTKEIEILQEELVDSEASLDGKRKVIRRFETSKNKLETLIAQLSRQLQREIKGNSLLTQEGMKVMRAHQDLISKLETTKADLELEARKLRTTMDISKQENTKLSTQKTELYNVLEIASEEKEKLAEQVRDYERRLKRSRDSLQTKNDECFRLKEENNELEEEIKQLKESHEAMTDAYNKRIDDLKTALKNERKDRQALMGKRDSISRDTNDFRSDYSDFMSDMNEKIQQAKLEHANLTDYGNKLQTQLKEHESSILQKQKLLKDSKMEYSTTQKNLKQELEQLQASVAKFEKIVAEKTNELDIKTPDYENLEKQFNQETEEFNQLKTLVAELKNKKASLELALNRGTKELERMKDPQKKLQADIEECRATALRDISEQNTEIRNIEKQNAECCQKLGIVLKENQKLEKANQGVLAEITALASQNTARLKNKALLCEQIDDYQNEIHAGRSEDLKLDKIFAQRDLKILDDIKKVQNETNKREKRVNEIHSQLESQIGLLSSFIDRVADLRPTTV